MDAQWETYMDSQRALDEAELVYARVVFEETAKAELDMEAAALAAEVETVVAEDATPCDEADLEWIGRMFAALKATEPSERERERLDIQLFDLADNGAFDPEREVITLV